MLALQVEVDGQHLAVAGVADWALLSAHITANKGDPKASAESARADRIDLSVGALSQPDSESISHHLRWGTFDLRAGSRVLITIVETNEPDAPIKRYRSDREVQENPFTEEETREFRWKDYLELKKEFEEQQGG
jgi:hypothetical protein